MEKTRNYVGIDISKLTFDVAITDKEGKYYHYKFSNDNKGFSVFKRLIDPKIHWCVMEASGPYYLRLAYFLQSIDVSVSVVNPLVIRRFCQMRLMRAKTDKKDAMMIASYGQMEEPILWEGQESYMLELRQLQAYTGQLHKQLAALNKQIEAFKQNPFGYKAVAKSMSQMIAHIEKQIDAMDQKMKDIVSTYHQQQYEQIKSIPGLGSKAAMSLIVLSDGFTKFDNAKQLSSYIGLSPRIYESGTSVKGRAKICKMGMSKVRALLYVCSWSAIKCNQACKEMYDRLKANGKSSKAALIAVCNKLLRQAFAIATKQEYYLQNS
jgi:transposase